MKNNSGIWIFVGVAILVTIVCVPVGYYFFATPPANVATPAQTSSATDSAAATPDAPQPKTVQDSSEYTAPDAPSIAIDEVKPKAVVKPPPAATPADTEASQTGVTPEGETPPGPAAGLITTSSATDTGTPTPESPTPPPPPAAQAPQPDANTPPPTPVVQPAAPTDPIAAGTVSPADDSTVFHVLVGKPFADEGNARIFAASLRHRGYMAVTEPINSGDGSLFKVQVGAYKSRVSAQDEVDLLQQSGYPAYIATDR